tara:strand:- start:5725 stop:6054 length:330 start_codon:yes stop_codon:yes gene_type:complete
MFDCQEFNDLSDSKQIQMLKQRIDDMQEYSDHRIESLETRFIHRGIHQEDAIDALTNRLANVLEGELRTVLVKALVAHSKGKENVVGFQIKDALRVLSRELARLNREKS